MFDSFGLHLKYHGSDAEWSWIAHQGNKHETCDMVQSKIYAKVNDFKILYGEKSCQLVET